MTSQTSTTHLTHLTCAEVASRAGCSQRTVRRAILAGELPGGRTNGGRGEYVVAAAVATKWIAQRGQVVPVKPAKKPSKKPR